MAEREKTAESFATSSREVDNIEVAQERPARWEFSPSTKRQDRSRCRCPYARTAGKLGARLVAIGLTLCVAASTLTACVPVADRAAAVVSADGARLSIEGATLDIAPGAATIGTEVELANGSHEFGELAHHAIPLREPVRVTFDDGSQPAKPITLSVAVDGGQVSDAEWSTPASYAMITQSDDGSSSELVPATWDPEKQELTATVEHLSWFQPIQFDLGAVLRSARDAVMQGTGIETARPDCVDKPADIAGVKFSASSPWGAWICLHERDGGLVVELTSNAPVPFLVTSSPDAPAQSLPGLDATGIVGQSIFNLLFAEKGALLAPGARAEITFGSSGGERIDLDQYPAMLILSILLKVFDVMLPSSISDALFLDKLGAADCAQNIIETATVGSLNAEAVGRLTQAFFACAEQALRDAGTSARIVLAILSAAPAFFAGSLIGLLNEFTGLDHMRVQIERTGDWTIEPGRIGPYRAMMSLDEFEETYGSDVATITEPSEFRCEPIDVRTYTDGSAVTFLWRAFADEYASILFIKAAPGEVAEASVMHTSSGIGLGSTLQELLDAYPNGLAPDRVYGPTDFSYRYGTDDGDISFYGTAEDGVTGISVTTPGGPTLDHFCS